MSESCYYFSMKHGFSKEINKNLKIRYFIKLQIPTFAYLQTYLYEQQLLSSVMKVHPVTFPHSFLYQIATKSCSVTNFTAKLENGSHRHNLIQLPGSFTSRYHGNHRNKPVHVHPPLPSSISPSSYVNVMQSTFD